MSVYTRLRPGATERPTRNLSLHCGSLGRAAVFADFHPRDARALDQDGFSDRLPCDRPVALGDVAVEVVGDVGRKALDHWLREAARTDGEEREAALEIAKEIAGMIGVPWAEIMSGGAT
jgi:hypothetical protein